jgi:hypothetical protein
MEVAESLLFAGRPSTSILSNIEKKVGNAAARELERKAIDKMKERMPSKSEVQGQIIRNPELAELSGRDPLAAAKKVQEENRAARQGYKKLKTAAEYGSDVPPSEKSYQQMLSEAPDPLTGMSRKPAKPAERTLDYSSMLTDEERRRRAAFSESPQSLVYEKGKGIISKVRKP